MSHRTPEKATVFRSPLDKLWRLHPQVIDDALLDSAASIDHAKQLRARLDRIARGDLRVDDAFDLRIVLARISLAMPSAAQAVRDHRAWEAGR